MLFNSWQFLLVFLPLSLIVYWSVDRAMPRLRLPTLLVLSLVFYSYWDVRFLPLLLLSVLINWSVARIFSSKPQSWLITAAIVANIGVLGVFKYTGFVTSLFEPFVVLPTSALRDLALPLGISFFTFHHVMYLTDLRRGAATQFGLVKYGLYIAFFPQVLSGPLVRWSEIMHQFDERPYQRADATARFAQGLTLLMLGLAKKVMISDPLATIADPLFHAANRGVNLPLLDAWQAALAFTFQIYFDFSGYTDMALGIALMFGIVLPQNFNAPYRATSLQDFWRRWHMTLSRFLRDYLYIPLGGNRHGLQIQLAALLATMTLGGLWHGAGANFVIWGALHGAALCVVLLWSRFNLPLHSLVGWALTFLFVVATWVPFRAETFESATLLWSAMAGQNAFDHRFTTAAGWPMIMVALLISIFGPTAWSICESSVSERSRLGWMTGAAAGVLATLVLLRFTEGQSTQFIYFQF